MLASMAPLTSGRYSVACIVKVIGCIYWISQLN